MATGHSIRCPDLKTYWNRTAGKCVPCTIKPGFAVNPNCGFDDDGGRHEVPLSACKGNTFNDGSGAYCKPCTVCSPHFDVISNCTLTTDTKCQLSRLQTTVAPSTSRSGVVSTGVKCPDLNTCWDKDAGKCVPCPTKPGFAVKPKPGLDDNVTYSPPSTISQLSSSIPRTTTLHNITIQHSHSLAWAVPLTIFISILLVLSACMIYIKRKRGHDLVFRRSKRSSLNKHGFSPLSTPTGTDLEHMLSPNILSAPLQTVLDNLDVLDELVILLDPESHGVKNTKHLASQCSFTSQWIKYTYSMRDSKSPLKAVLEGVTCRNPDWTVGHLAKLLKLIERNDAVAVLAKLSENSIVV